MSQRAQHKSRLVFIFFEETCELWEDISIPELIKVVLLNGEKHQERTGGRYCTWKLIECFLSHGGKVTSVP